MVFFVSISKSVLKYKLNAKNKFLAFNKKNRETGEIFMNKTVQILKLSVVPVLVLLSTTVATLSLNTSTNSAPQITAYAATSQKRVSIGIHSKTYPALTYHYSQAGYSGTLSRVAVERDAATGEYIGIYQGTVYQ
ncbi:hypothetical protein [Oenococcus kitaharae]|uniref:Uncharacterized protein n=1 Tax=Oenococcus kitaharae DSM 17330 TaxID=1045004 RepID=G9WJ73_9LACO|nr:hypothetical protein [Oenococcus kitaharae]EHN58522.1 hypothetical protein OKIT_0401 [Oenococcus kitaharae DSM 17330]OEY81332.1 hypothetical protein NT95_07360 [Oenococcus kitaharae]OEY82820.1 hypothetical protein NV75_05460 [Oenococcus kitaharae]OEY84636.1 hypothetical protein NT96_05175 [Oenococcus kitaharae]